MSARAETGKSPRSLRDDNASARVGARNTSTRSHASELEELNSSTASACGCHVCYADTVEGSHDSLRLTMNGAEFRVIRRIYVTQTFCHNSLWGSHVEEFLYLETAWQVQMALT